MLVAAPAVTQIVLEARVLGQVMSWRCGGGKHKKGQGARLGDVMRRTSALRLDAEGGPPLAFAHLP